MSHPLIDHTWSIHSIGHGTRSLDPETIESTVAAVVQPKQGDSVRVTWLARHSETRKRPREDSVYDSHLSIELWLDETFDAAVVFVSNGERWPFCLVRGHKASSADLWRWMEIQTACPINPQPLKPTPTELAELVAGWTLDDFKGQQDKQTIDPRPLVLTLQAPDFVREKGLDTLSASIPPSALIQLCRDIERHKPKQRPNGKTDGETQLPIYRAIQLYLHEALRVKPNAMVLTKASCPTATLGCDGRCKPHRAETIESMLAAIGNLIERRQCTTNEEESSGDSDEGEEDVKLNSSRS